MAKNLALICVENSKVKEMVNGMGNVLSSVDVVKIEGMSFMDDTLRYCPVFLCQEGSPVYEKLKANGWVDEDGRKYDVVKEVSFRT
ncbi:MAG: hypothetical protein NTW17_02130 [Candidatus Pacearchaeota archaeon]|nr:hypothetical protein [Candidatus Pacearchaeota archaeon]